MRKRMIMLAAAVCLLALLVSGCSTTVAFNVLKPAEVNMSEYRSLAVFDFEPYEMNKEIFASKLILSLLFDDQQITTTGYRYDLDDEIAEYMTDRTIRALSNTDYFTIASAGKLDPFQNLTANALVSNKDLYGSLGIEAVVVGEIEDMDYNEYVDENEKEVWNAETEVYDTVVEAYFIQEVELGVSYKVVDMVNNRIIATDYLSGSDRTRTYIEDADDFDAPALEPMYKNIVRSFETSIKRKLAPYYVREYRNIMKDDWNDPRSETAEQYIKDEMYKPALDLYLEMWYDKKNISAGFNAAIVYEVMGQFDSAISIMKDVYDATGSRDASQEYARLQKVKEEYQRAAAQY